MSTEPRRRQGRRERRGPGPARPPGLACVAEKRSELEAWTAKPLPASPRTASGWPLTKPVAVNLLCPSPPPPSPPPTRPRLPRLTQDAWPPSSRLLAAERGAPCLPAAALGHRDTALEAEAVETQQKYEPLRGGGAHVRRGQPRSRHLVRPHSAAAVADGADAPHRVTHEFRTKQPEKPSS